MSSGNSLPQLQQFDATIQQWIDQLEDYTLEMLCRPPAPKSWSLGQMAETLKTTADGDKTRHPGLEFFSAVEWLQFAEMHMRHHGRQKKRIDEFLFS